jgi:hypothetical protein
VQFILSMKAYAMRQAQSSELHFEILRGAWADTIRLAIFGAPVQAARRRHRAAARHSAP